jgi:hypothetical protein
MMLPLDDESNYAAGGCNDDGGTYRHYQNGDGCSGTDLRHNGTKQIFATEYMPPQEYVPWCMDDVFRSDSPYVLRYPEH